MYFIKIIHNLYIFIYIIVIVSITTGFNIVLDHIKFAVFRYRYV